MIIEIKIPSPGESINEVEIARWFVKNGDIVQKDQELAEIESDKATLSLTAEQSGKIIILIPVEQTVKVGSVACTIDTSFDTKNDEIPEIKIDEPDAIIAEKDKTVESSILEKDRIHFW